jgi:hypothetical protein
VGTRLEGVGSVVSYYPDLAVPGAIETVMRSPTRSEEGVHGWCSCPAAANRAQRAEQAVRDSGMI